MTNRVNILLKRVEKLSRRIHNYRIVVLQDGVRPAAYIGRSWRAARQILDNVDLPWGQQVVVMFQIVCALAKDVPEVLHELEQLRGVLPNVILSCEPCGYMQHADIDCVCLSSDRTGAYIHDLSITSSSPDASSAEGAAPESPSVAGDIHSVTRRPGSVPYVSQHAYDRLLLADWTVNGL